MSSKIIKRVLLKLVSYSLILFIVTKLFNKYFYIDTNMYGFWIIISACIICLLNKIIKPIIFKLTLPIIAITYGLFYPMIDVFIIYMTSIILKSHFEINNIFICFIIAIVILILEYIIENSISKIFNRKR